MRHLTMPDPFDRKLAPVKNLLEIISQPDNIAILIMLIATAVCTLVAFREIRINDRLIKEGKKEEIYQRMIK
jgi:hypothetical protein